MAAFTVYLATEEPKIKIELPLLDSPLDIPWASEISENNNILIKPRFKLDAPEESASPTNNDISFEELVKLENLPIRITSGFRGYGTKTALGKLSNHGKLDIYGNSMAYDIVPTNGDFEGLLNQIYSNQRVINWLKSRGYGILEETTPNIMKKTKATGKHLHIGPDPGAIKLFNQRLAKGAKGMKIPFTEYLPVEEPKVTILLPTFDSPINIDDWSSGVTNEGVPIVKLRFNIDTPEETNMPIITNNNETIKTSNNEVVNYFINKGLSKNASIGITANLMQESNLNPKAVNPKSGAYGIAQWLGPRKTKLFNKYGKNPTLELLLDFIWEELNSTEKQTLTRLQEIKSYLEAIHSFMNLYERPSAREKADSIQTRLNFGKMLSNG